MNQNQLAIIHIAKKETGLSDDNYRELLQGAAGISSSKDIKLNYQFFSVMRAFERIGFKSTSKKDYSSAFDSWGCSEAQQKYIEGLWKLVARDKSRKALSSFICRIAKIDDPRFLTVKLGQEIILALRQMCIDNGINPDRPREEVR